MKTFLHVDINSYFATMLQQKYPHLRGQPLGIVKDIGRMCIIAASKEAKVKGVKTGSGVPDARSRCPDLKLEAAEFDFYLDSTLKLKKLFEALSPHVEIFSLDEAFIDITHCQKHLYPDSQLFAQTIQTKIKQTLGDWVTCNIGIGPNRFLSKLASEISPKGSITIINQKNLDEYISKAPFTDICGIGLRLEKRLKDLGLDNLYAINFVSDDFLEKHFGPFWSKQLRIMASGGEPHFLTLIDRNPHAKSIGRSITGYQLTKNQDLIKSVLYNLTEEVIHKARKMQLAGRQISIGLYGHQKSWGNHVTLKHFVCHTQDMFYHLYHQLFSSWPRNFSVIKFAVRLGLLKPWHQISLGLLPKWQTQEKLSLALDKINDKYGLFTVKSGLLVSKKIIMPEVTGFLGDKHYQFM